MFGRRKVNLQSDIMLPFQRTEEASDLPEYVNDLRQRMGKSFDIVRQNLKAAAESQSRQHDNRIVENQYKIGDIVYFNLRPSRSWMESTMDLIL